MSEPIQSKGGHARAASLSPEERAEQARKAAAKRWGCGVDEVLRLPLGGGRGTIIIPPMSEADYDLLMKTLKLWRAKIVR